MLFLHREDGQGLVEYALVLVLVAVVVIAILTLLGPHRLVTYLAVLLAVSTPNIWRYSF